MHVIMITLLFQKKKSTGGSYLDQWQLDHQLLSANIILKLSSVLQLTCEVKFRNILISYSTSHNFLMRVFETLNSSKRQGKNISMNGHINLTARNAYQQISTNCKIKLNEAALVHTHILIHQPKVHTRIYKRRVKEKQKGERN
jgi:hypothetical protein